MTPFVLPRGSTGFNIDDTPAQQDRRRDLFVTWSRALAVSSNSTATIIESVGSFDVIEVEELTLWLLHNRFLPLMGVVTQPPIAGFAYAVDTVFADLPSIPTHLTGWGPQLLPAEVLNCELSPNAWSAFSPPARAHADRFKPTKIGHVLFNYWD